MRKVEINNEIVLLRQSVRQARICVINKLVREVKRLRSSHGNEKQLGKYRNKADKLLREVSALKHVKVDEILKFVIIRFDNLQAILQSPPIDDGNRVMAKVARYKTLSAKILEFREKYPDYSEHISWAKKKMLLPQRKRNSTTNLKNGHSKSLQIGNTNSGKENLHKDEKIPYNIAPVLHTAWGKSAEAPIEPDALMETISNAVSMGDEKGLSIKAKITDVKEQTQNSRETKLITKAINCQVTVKKFTEFLQEMELNEQNTSHEEAKNDQPANRRLESLKEANDFFLHVHDAISHSNVTQRLGRTSIDRALNVNHKSSMSFQVQDKKNKINVDGLSKERTDYRRQRMNNKHVPEDQTGKNAQTSRQYKQSKNSLVNKRRSLNIEEVSNNERLHPSWAAKKKQQDIMKQGFQGKKIKFNED